MSSAGKNRNLARKLYRRPPSSTPSRRELKRAEQQTAKPETAVAPDSTRQRPATPLSGKELYAAATSGPQLRRHHARNVLGQAGTLPANKIKDGCVDEKSASETTASIGGSLVTSIGCHL